MVSHQADSTNASHTVSASQSSGPANINVSVSIPACDIPSDGQAVTVLLSPRKLVRSSNLLGAAPAYHDIKPIAFNTSAVYSAVATTLNTVEITSPSAPLPSPPSAPLPSPPSAPLPTTSPTTTFSTTAIVYESDEEVFNIGTRGQKEKKWYVITRGRKVGVFYKYWFVSLYNNFSILTISQPGRT
jgi:hypothetical protein